MESSGEICAGASADFDNFKGSMEVPHIHDLGVGVLAKIFSMVVGPRTVKFDPFFGGFFRSGPSCPRAEKEIEPTVVNDFQNILSLPLVCRRWRKIVETTPTLWEHVFVGKSEENCCGGFHPVISMLWLARHRDCIKSMHIRGHKTRIDGPLDTFNLGAVSLLSGICLTILHLDDCFEFGATQTLLPVLSGLKSLEQLQVGPAKDDFIRGVSSLTTLTKLRVLELQGMEDACVSMTPRTFPSTLEVLGLGAVDIEEAENGEYLPNIKVLKLVEVDWNGPFCGYMEQLSNLRELILLDVFHLDEDFVAPDYFPNDLSGLSSLSNLKHFEVQGDLELEDQGFFERLGEEILRSPPFLSITHLCLSFHSLGKMSPDFGQYEYLTQLHLEGFNFVDFPEAILNLPHLVDLGLAQCHLVHVPDTAPKCVKSIREVRFPLNGLQCIPHGLKHWSSVRVLDLSGNPIVLGDEVNVLLQLKKLESIQIFEGNTRVGGRASDLKGICADMAHRCPDFVASFLFGFVCGELQGRKEPCHVYI